MNSIKVITVVLFGTILTSSFKIDINTATLSVKNITKKTQDTILITPLNINTNVLKEGKHRYLVYFRKGENSPRSNVSFWTRIIKREIYNNTNAIVISQIWEAKDTIATLK